MLTRVGSLVLDVVRRRLVVVTVIGASMAPTYRPGERVLVRRAPAHAVRRGEVVVFAEPGEQGGYMIKRAVAVPGDLVPSELCERPEATVPADRLVVLGDNPNGSFDSRVFGYVAGDRVLGVVVRRLASSR